MNLRSLMRQDLLSLEAYPPQPRYAELSARCGHPVARLDANENPYGPSPLVAEALRACPPDRYPDPDCTELRHALGEYLDVDPARIVCSAGGDEMIDLLLRLFLEPGDEVIDLVPSFFMYRPCTVFHRGRYVPVARREDTGVDMDALERAVTPRTKVIFLCSPNNPTGWSTPDEDILRVLEWGRVVVLDEAYAEFAGRTLVRLVERYPNLIVLRTMSKWASLAGVRLGYAIGDPSLVEEMKRIKSPFNVNIAAQVAGVASLRDREYLMANVRRIIAERERLHGLLASLPFGRVFPSMTNFLYWTTGGVSPGALREALAERGVMVRAFADFGALRFTVGRQQESEWLVEALGEVFPAVAMSGLAAR